MADTNTLPRLAPGSILKLVTAGESCVQCRAAERALDAAGVDYEIIEHASLVDEEIKYLRGFGTRLPVGISPSGEVWQGFRPDKIGELAAARGISS